MSTVNCSIVLAGDPMQLDAMTQSKYASELGFKTSFMEKLLQKPCYMRNKISHEFHSRYITQLVQNYRSHYNILEVPNELFYEKQLIPKASKGLSKENHRILYKSNKGSLVMNNQSAYHNLIQIYLIQ